MAYKLMERAGFEGMREKLSFAKRGDVIVARFQVFEMPD